MHGLDFSALGISRSNAINLIDEWVLNERDREIMKRRHIDGIKYERLAEEFDLSVRQVKKIVCKNDMNIMKHL